MFALVNLRPDIEIVILFLGYWWLCYSLHLMIGMELQSIYESWSIDEAIVYWRKSIFILPLGDRIVLTLIMCSTIVICFTHIYWYNCVFSPTRDKYKDTRTHTFCDRWRVWKVKCLKGDEIPPYSLLLDKVLASSSNISFPCCSLFLPNLMKRCVSIMQSHIHLLSCIQH